MPKVIFQIEGAAAVEVACNAGDNLLELARRANVAIDAPCSGNGSCGKCRVKLVEGELDTFPSGEGFRREQVPALRNRTERNFTYESNLPN